MTPSPLTTLAEVLSCSSRPLRFMEVCGTHTMAVFRHGLRALLPPKLTLLSGPGCPVCVTSTGFVDDALTLAQRANLHITTFGDMLKVPGSTVSLEQARREGAHIHVVYSPLDALQMAQDHPEADIVFLGIGFETTAPTVARSIQLARQKKTTNFSVLSAHKVMPPAMTALLASGDLHLDGLLCPGHVSVIIGSQAYEPLCAQFSKPCVITGFDAFDIIEGLLMLSQQATASEFRVANQYHRAVSAFGNPNARQIMTDVFEPSDAWWRGLGLIPGSGLRIRSTYADWDARIRYALNESFTSCDTPDCRCGDVLRGSITPTECPLFASTCTPDTPCGACMVSSEGTCAAYYRYARTTAQGSIL